MPGVRFESVFYSERAAMKPHPRIRRTAKWAGLAASVLLAAAWLGSAWRALGYWDDLTDRDVAIARGCLFVGMCVDKRAAPWEYGVRVHRIEASFWWWLHSGSSGARNWFVAVPLWTLLAPTVAATLAAWRLDAAARRRERVGFGHNCGYDLTGNTTGLCPECGRGRP